MRGPLVESVLPWILVCLVGVRDVHVLRNLYKGAPTSDRRMYLVWV